MLDYYNESKKTSVRAEVFFRLMNCSLLFLLFSPSGKACESSKHLSLANAIQQEVQLLRKNPKAYSQTVEKFWQQDHKLQQNLRHLCQSTEKALQEVQKIVSLLRQQPSDKAHRRQSQLDKVACNIVQDMAEKDQINPLHQDYSSFFKKDFSSQKTQQLVSVSSGMSRARAIVIRFLVGDCLFQGSQGTSFTQENIFWTNILSTEYPISGISCSHHPLSSFDGDKVMCAHIVFKKGKKILKGYQKGFEEL